MAALRYLDALVAIHPEDPYHRTLRAMKRYGEGMLEEALKDVIFLLEKFPNDPANGALLEIKRRLSQPH